MFEEREVLTFLISIGILGFGLRQRRDLSAIPNSAVLLSSFGLLVLSFCFSVFEVVGMSDVLNVAQHVAAALAGLSLLYWSWKTLRPIAEGPE